MAREGISYDQVAAVADEILGEGQQPTIRGIRERTGTGSPNTIHRHLSTWREARPQASAVAPTLPESITAALAAEFGKVAAQARGEVEGRLVQALAESADLAAAGEQLETERDKLIEQVTELTTKYDQATATATERGLEIERLNQDLGKERSAAESARIEVAQNRNKLETQAEKIIEQAKEIEELRAQLKDQTQRSIEAEKKEAVNAALLEGATLNAQAESTRAKKAEADLVECKTTLNEIQDLAKQDAQKYEAAQKAIASLETRLETLQTQFKDQSKELDASRLEAKNALQEAAELRGMALERGEQPKKPAAKPKAEPKKASD